MNIHRVAMICMFVGFNLFVSTTLYAEDALNFLFSDKTTKDGRFFAPPSLLFKVPEIPGLSPVIDPQQRDTLKLVGTLQDTPIAITIYGFSIPKESTPGHMMLRSRDYVLNKLPHFEIKSTQTILIGGQVGVQLIGQYDYLGNKAYTMMIEESYFKDNTNGFIFHLEIPQGFYPALAPVMQQIYQGFVPQQLIPTTLPAEEPKKPKKTKKTNKKNQ